MEKDAALGRYGVLLPEEVYRVVATEMNQRHDEKFDLAVESSTGHQHNDERFRLVVEASPNAIIMVNDEGCIALVNTRTEQLFGYSRDELLNSPVEILVPERYRSAHPGHRARFFEHPSTRAMGAGRDLYGLRKDGREVPIEIGLNPIQMHEGSFVLASIIDITERKRAEDRFRQLIEHAPNGMVMVDHEGKMAFVNAQIEESFAYTRDELLGQPIEMLVPARFRAHHSGYRNAFLANPTARPMGSGRDLFGLRKDGSEFPVEIGLNPIETEQGVMVLGTIVDITERKQAEHDLRRSQEQLAGVIGSAMDAIITVDGEQRITLFNNAAERMFLFSSEDAIGQPLDRFIPQRFRVDHKRHIQDFGKTHVTKRSMGTLGALYALRANGQEFPIEASISQIESEGQKLFTVILRDITERKQAEAALKEQAQVLDLAPVFIRDPVDDRLVFWNTGAQQMYGWTEEDAIGKVSYEFLRTVFPQPREKIQAMLFARGHWEGELMHTRRDGEQIIVASHWVLHRDDDGQPKAILEVNNDITNWRRAEEKLTRLATAVEQSGDSIVITDTDGNIQYVNPAFEQITGYSSDEVIGKNPRFLKGGKASTESYQNLWATITSGSQWTGHFTNKKKDGTLFEEEATISPVRDGIGQIVSYVAVKRDVTERRRSEEAIRRLNETLEERVADRTAELEAANKELEAFSYSVSHDLRAPLRHINGFSQALLEDYSDKLDDGGKSYLTEVRNASQEMAQLIDDVLQLARVTRSEMRREEVSLSELARGVVADLQKGNGRRAVTVHIEDGLWTRGDKRLLRIVLTNLLGNAWKFTSRQEQAEITFGSERQNNQVSYFVRDNGAGFEMAYVNKLFGAFQRLHTAGEFEGTGIGLATVQRIVTRHGGRVWATGKVDEGATFYFALPDFKETGDGQQSDPASRR
jgi:PAS domain S-box-containing protein